MLYNRHNLAVSKIASLDTYKPVLSSVFFSKEKTVATDSFRLLEVSVDTSVKAEDFPQVQGNSAMHGCKPFLAEARQVAEIKIPKGKGLLPITQYAALKHVDDKHVEFLTTDMSVASVMSARRIDDTFPSYEQIFPQGKAVAKVTINGALLAEMLKIMSEMTPQGTVTLYLYGGELPLELRAESTTQKARGLLMPIRDNK